MGKRELLLLEEQTLLSRERTMQQYITTSLALIGVGILVLKFFEGAYYIILGILLNTLGFVQITMAYIRFIRYRKVVRRLRKKERKFRLDIGE